MNKQVLQFILEEENPNGIIECSVDDWFGISYKIPRNKLKEASSLEQVKKSKTPILFIHGDKDDFVPEYMCEKLYDATNCKKEKIIIHGAGHTDGKYREPEKYYNTIFDWISR